MEGKIQGGGGKYKAEGKHKMEGKIQGGEGKYTAERVKYKAEGEDTRWRGKTQNGKRKIKPEWIKNLSGRLRYFFFSF